MSAHTLNLSDITFDMVDRHILAAFLDDIEESGNSVTTRNLRLNCIRAFYNYASKVESAAVIFLRLEMIIDMPRK